MMEIKKISFFGGSSSYECRIGTRCLIVSADFGPRIMSLSVGGGPNILFVDEKKAHGRGDWRLYGGHRLWVAPEAEITYAPDNDPCRITTENGTITVTALNKATRIEKSLTITERGGDFVVTHAVVNRSDTLIPGAIWALTCVTPDAVAFFPWGTGTNWDLKKIVYWKAWMGNSTDIKSSRYMPSDDLFIVRPDGAVGKVGTSGRGGFIGVTGDGFTFVKSFARHPSALYPDEDCAVQCYTCADFTEIETLGPLGTFFPNRPVVHEEVWIIRETEVDPEDGAAVRGLIDRK